MSSTTKLLTTLMFSIGMLALSGCGGGSSNNAPVPGNCAAGQVYSASYGCLTQGNCSGGYAMSPQGGGCMSIAGSVVSNCTSTAQGVMVYTAQGCLPQGNCPPGQGSSISNGYQQCVPAQTQNYGYGAGGCHVAGQVMTSKGCLPQGYPCPAGSGVLNNQCYPSYAGNPQGMIQGQSSSFGGETSLGDDDETPCDDETIRYRTVRRVRTPRLRVFYYGY
jgi:hypothetical protein